MVQLFVACCLLSIACCLVLDACCLILEAWCSMLASYYLLLAAGGAAQGTLLTRSARTAALGSEAQRNAKNEHGAADERAGR